VDLSRFSNSRAPGGRPVSRRRSKSNDGASNSVIERGPLSAAGRDALSGKLARRVLSDSERNEAEKIRKRTLFLPENSTLTGEPPGIWTSATTADGWIVTRSCLARAGCADQDCATSLAFECSSCLAALSGISLFTRSTLVLSIHASQQRERQSSRRAARPPRRVATSQRRHSSCYAAGAGPDRRAAEWFDTRTIFPKLLSCPPECWHQAPQFPAMLPTPRRLT